MGGMNVNRWLLGGLVAGLIIWLCEGAASVLYRSDMETALQAHNLSTMAVTLGTVVSSVVLSLLIGFTLVFFYAASRPRFGPGPKTAVTVAVVLWVGGYVVTLMGYAMLGLFPSSMLTLWGVVGLVEMTLAAVAGAWIYRES